MDRLTADAAGIRGLADLWVSVARKEIFPAHPVAGALGMLGRRSHLVPNTGLRRLLADKLERNPRPPARPGC